MGGGSCMRSCRFTPISATERTHRSDACLMQVAVDLAIGKRNSASDNQRIPAQAGDHFDFLGHPKAGLPLTLRVSGSPFFACAKKGNRKKHTRWRALRTSLCSECARPLRGSLNAHPCACSERARIVRALLRTFPPRPRRATGAPFGGILPQKQKQKQKRKARAEQQRAFQAGSLYVVHGWTAFLQ